MLGVSLKPVVLPITTTSVAERYKKWNAKRAFAPVHCDLRYQGQLEDKDKSVGNRFEQCNALARKGEPQG